MLFHSCRLLIISCSFLALTRALEILFAEQQKQKVGGVFQEFSPRQPEEAVVVITNLETNR